MKSLNITEMRVSIITVTYNSEKTVSDTLSSVLSQTYPDIEYIIIDGKSSDSTIDIIRCFVPKFNGRITYISEEDSGVYDAMNKGISLASGDIVGILNSDDYFTDIYVVERIVREFECSNIDAVYGDVHFVKDNNLSKCVRYYSSSMFHPRFLRFGFMPAHPSFYVRRDIYLKYGSYSLSYKIAADYDLMVRLFYKARIKYKYIKKDFVTMRVGGLSTRNVRSRLLITKEDVLACRRNGMYTNIFFISCKYIVKIFEFKL
jgi:glycosyltransferase involved in cell wall biosynthesis